MLDPRLLDVPGRSPLARTDGMYSVIHHEYLLVVNLYFVSRYIQYWVLISV